MENKYSSRTFYTQKGDKHETTIYEVGHRLSGLVRPPLSKKSFPVCRMGKKKARQEVGIFFFSVFNFSLPGMYQED